MGTITSITQMLESTAKALHALAKFETITFRDTIVPSPGLTGGVLWLWAFLRLAVENASTTPNGY